MNAVALVAHESAHERFARLMATACREHASGEWLMAGMTSFMAARSIDDLPACDRTRARDLLYAFHRAHGYIRCFTTTVRVNTVRGRVAP